MLIIADINIMLKAFNNIRYTK